MTPSQEEALYEFLDSVTEIFKLDDAVSFVRNIDPKRGNRLDKEVEAFIDLRHLAFLKGAKCWISRRGFFERLPFVISPTRLELVNGIFIPGHRCVPFASASLFPHEYVFFWQNSEIPFTTTEGSPDEFYPYYSIFGEEYAPQYVARDNSENEEAFNDDPYDDPPIVSIKTLDMRNIYRETAFVPGDRFLVRSLDWKQGKFDLEKVGKDEWEEAELKAWFDAAEEGFEASFRNLGPASCTEEQIAYAYWYAPVRMREIPAYALEDYIYEKTDKIEITAYGIETRFWHAGRDIPDKKGLDSSNVRPDMTPVEDVLNKLNIPVSEYVIQSYVRDSLYRENGDSDLIAERLVPPSVEQDKSDRVFLAEYIESVLEKFREFYSPFMDKKTGQIRQRAGELHTAVIDLAARLSKGEIDLSWLPRHTFIVLSQIQNHTASVMEDLDSDEAPPELEIEALDNSLDSMIETYEDVKELIDEALESFRRNRLAVIRSGSESVTEWLLQLSVGGIDIWRRVIVPGSLNLFELHKIIQAVFSWQNSENFKFKSENTLFQNGINLETQISDLEAGNNVELLYEYGAKWNVKIMMLSRQETPGLRQVRCVAGAGAAPPEFIAGPLKYRRILSTLENGNDLERQNARRELGPDFVLGEFDLEACNRLLASAVHLNQQPRPEGLGIKPLSTNK
jgi:hypothetical protein